MIIKFENEKFVYNRGTGGEKPALSGINRQRGEPGFTAIIGSTGSGKSTLSQLLNGLLAPTDGTITYDGEDIYAQKNSKKLIRDIRCRVGLTFQYPEYQLFEETLFKDVAFGPKNLGLSEEEIDRRVRNALAAVNLTEEYFEKSPFDLSGGEMRRAAIAGMLAMEPEILILDEPTAGLDPLGKKLLLDKLKEIQQERKISVILVSHTMEEVAEYAERVIALDKGNIKFDLPVHEIFRHGDELKEMGLSVPEVKLFAGELSAAGLNINTDVITVDEAFKAIIAAIKK